jgi:diguanylate cyclase (GGDEF)-like protein
MRRWLRAYQLYFAAAAVVVVAVPGHTVHYLTLYGWELSVLPAMVITIGVILREAQHGNPEARTVALGTFIFIAACINDLLIDLAHLDAVRLAPAGFVAILIAMAVSMANRFTDMFNRLEAEVTERTAELREANEKLARAARVDHLTGLLNRRGFNEEAESESFRAFRSGKPFSVVLADVDHFKQVNDEYGHACGDHVLKRVATILAERTRDVDRVARWGGEEFILLLPETDTRGAAVIAEKLREAISENLFEYSGRRLSITMTFGIAEHRKGEALEACIARADTALYTGKERGRNRVMIGKYRGLTLVS